MSEATYKIDNSEYRPSDKCICTHTFAAHGSNGYICCACSCPEFKSVSECNDYTQEILK